MSSSTGRVPNVEQRILKRLKRLRRMAKALKETHHGNETKFTYYGGFDYGYLRGKIAALESVLNMMQELKQTRKLKGNP